MKDDFSYTPLAQIADKVRVKNTKKGMPSKVNALGEHSAHECSLHSLHITDSDEDSRIFLHAVQAAVPSKKKHEEMGHFSVQDVVVSQHLWNKKIQKLSLKRTKHKKNNDLSRQALNGAVSEKKAADLDRESDTAPNSNNMSNAIPSDDDSAIFLRAMGNVENLSGKGRAVVPAVQSTVPSVSSEDPLQDFMDGQCEFALALTGEYMEGFVVGLDTKILERLRAGQYSPEAHLDMHGLNAVQAYHALVGFFRNAWYKGLRSVLLVPGRGKNSPNGISVLKDKLQLWLTQEPFKRVVLAFCTARPVDGGPGSVYVLLRRYRKKGKIHWERLPVDADVL